MTAQTRIRSARLAHHPSRARTPPQPRDHAWLTRRDVAVAVSAIGVLLAVMWIRHGGPAQDPWTAFGEVTALGGTYAALLGILFASRAPWIDQVFGADGMRRIHTWLGFISVWAIGIHAVASTVAWAGGSVADSMSTLVALVETEPGLLGAVIGMSLLVVVAVSSMRAARRRVSYESWHGVHLYIYLAMAFGFLHQLTVGQDFVDDPMARAFWLLLYTIAFVPLLIHRVIWPIAFTVRHRPRVQAIGTEAEGVVSLVVGGSAMGRLAVRAGQFFVVRALTRRDWMHGHPLSISAAPDGRTLRFTFKIVGEGTRDLASLQPGTRLLLEGPYGAMHDGRRTGRRLLMVAGGIGIAPIRALAEGLDLRPGTTDLIYRSPDPTDVPLRHELEALARARGIRLHLIAGRRGDPRVGPDPLGPDAIARLVPHAATCDIYICGPEPLMDHARGSLLALGAAPGRINLESFG